MGSVLVALTAAAAALLLLALPAQGIHRPEVYSLRVVSEVRNRYAKTLISSRVANPAKRAQEISFDAVLPEKAFISGFVIEMDGVAYQAYVRGKEAARQEYDAAVAAGRGAAHVALSARDSNVVHVSVNVEAKKKVTFNLTYEELLQRELGAYNMRVHINPGQVVNELSVEVRVDEKAPLQLLQVPDLQETNEIVDVAENATNPLAQIERPSESSAIVRWAPTKEQQAALREAGVRGQLVVRYDVDRAASPDQILVSEDGYFVHFYAPPGLPSLPKHVVFVLDVSGSMYGRKVEQLKAAMHTILDELNEGDTFSLIPFASKVQVWHPDVPLDFSYSFDESLNPAFNASAIVAATRDNIEKAKRSVTSFEANGGTYMYSALNTALRVSEAGGATGGGGSHRRHAPMLLLLTDGEPNGQVSDPDEIVRRFTSRNAESGAALFTLAFGAGADYNFLRRLALRNGGVGRRIYEAADAHLQLRNFYRQIASPLLADVTFNYDGAQVEETSLTTVSFPTLFRGGELVVAGRLISDAASASASAEPWCAVTSAAGNTTTTTPTVVNASSAERLWAYLTVRQLLDQDAAAPNATLRDKAKEIALRYSFVTSVTSLVVVKPNATSAVNLDPSDASEEDSPARMPVVPLSLGMGRPPTVMFPPPQQTPRAYYPMAFHRTASSSVVPKWSGGRPAVALHSFSSPVESYDIADNSDSWAAVTTDRIVATTIPSVAAQRLALSDITWLDALRNGSDVTLRVNDTERHFHLALNQTDGSFGNCTTPQPQSQPGTCRHLAACVLTAFATDLQAFLAGYLCVADTNFLGACCPDSVLVGTGA